MWIFPLPLSYRCLISRVCLAPEMAYLAVLSPVAASISLSCPVSFERSELTEVYPNPKTMFPLHEFAAMSVKDASVLYDRQAKPSAQAYDAIRPYPKHTAFA